MKIACDKCLKVFEHDGKSDLLKVSTEHSVFYLCKDCQYGFWRSVDSKQPAIKKGGE